MILVKCSKPGNRNSALGGAELISTMCFFFLYLLTCFFFFDPDWDSCKNLTGSSPPVNSSISSLFSATLKGHSMIWVDPKLNSPLMRSPICYCVTFTFHARSDATKPVTGKSTDRISCQEISESLNLMSSFSLFVIMFYSHLQVLVDLHGSEHSHPRAQLPHVHSRNEGAGGDLLRPG